MTFDKDIISMIVEENKRFVEREEHKIINGKDIIFFRHIETTKKDCLCHKCCIAPYTRLCEAMHCQKIDERVSYYTLVSNIPSNSIKDLKVMPDNDIVKPEIGINIDERNEKLREKVLLLIERETPFIGYRRRINKLFYPLMKCKRGEVGYKSEKEARIQSVEMYREMMLDQSKFDKYIIRNERKSIETYKVIFKSKQFLETYRTKEEAADALTLIVNTYCNEIIKNIRKMC